MLPRILVRFLAFILVTAGVQAQTTPSPQPAASPATITATFWNVQWFPGRRPNASRAEENRQVRAVHADLAQFNSDLIALEEVRDFEHAALAVKSLHGFRCLLEFSAARRSERGAASSHHQPAATAQRLG